MPLLQLSSPLAPPPIELNPWWQCAHATSFAIGGTSFIAGTIALYYPGWGPSAWVSALLYTVGSLGFLSVDLQEFWTYTTDPMLRTNIALSATGSFLYVVGSVGFFPHVFSKTPVVGLLGFIGGSALIGISQLWKTARYMSTRGTPCAERCTAIGVELNAGIGAWCFLVGTALFAAAPGVAPTGDTLLVILGVWEAGSVFFTLGAVFLAFRHAVLRIS